MTLRTEFGRILITGAGGRVATAFRQSVGNRYQLRLAEKDLGLLTNLQPNDEIISFDIADIAACRAACASIDTVLHLAADPSPDADFCNSLMDNNILAALGALHLPLPLCLVHVVNPEQQAVVHDLKAFQHLNTGHTQTDANVQ